MVRWRSRPLGGCQLTACLVAMVVAGASARQQQPPQPPTFRSNVELVQVDVVVVDKDGNAIRGLTKDNFTVLDRGKPQQLATFEEVSHEHDGAATTPARLLPSVRLDVANNRSAQADRLIVLVVDDLHIWKSRTDRAKDIAQKVVDQLGPESSMAVLFTSGDHNTQVTADHALLAAAIDTLKGRQSVRRPHSAIDAQHPGRIDPEASMASALATVQQAQDIKVQDFSDNMQQYSTLERAAKLVGSGDARRKAFVLLSEGIGKDLSGIFGAMAPEGQASQSGSDYASGNVEAFAGSGIQPTGFHALQLVQMMDALRRANVATYSIDPRGKVNPQDLQAECFPPPRDLGSDPCSDGLTAWTSLVRQAQQGLQITSIATGGFAVTNTDDFTSGLRQIVEDIDHYYLLGFYPADAGKGYRRLDVKIAGHPDWVLRFRHGYQAGGPPAPPKNSNPLVALSADVMPKTDLPLRLSAIALPGTGKTARVAFALEVSAPTRALEEADKRVRDTLKYEVLVVDEKKAKVTSVTGREGRLTLSPNPAGGAPPETVTYQVDDGLDLGPGRYQLRVSALSEKLQKGGSVYLDVDVPNFADEPVSLGGIVVGYASGPHVPVAPSVTPRAGRGPAVAGPMFGVPLPFAPTLDREFQSAETLRIFVSGAVRDRNRAAHAIVRVVDAHNAVLQGSDLPFENGRVELRIGLARFQPGAYVLRVILDDGVHTATRETAFAVK